MSKSNRRWILRAANGHIEGPFTTEQVLAKIGSSEIAGDESIAHYPDGKWIRISQDPKFYDKLLEVLAASEVAGTDEDTPVLEFKKPITKTGEPSATGTPQRSLSQAINVTNAKRSTEPPPPSPTQQTRRRKKRKPPPEDIELIDTRPQLWKAIASRAAVPALIVIAGLALAALFMNNNDATEERIHLLAPQKNVKAVAPEALKPRMRQGVSEFLHDTFDGYLRSQNDLVYVVEHDNKNAEVMALLCLDYMQLWPYSHQDSADSRAIASVVQMSAAVDPSGVHAATCRAVDLLLRARVQEAKSLVEAMLDSRANEAAPPIIFYFLKGYLLELTKDHATAVNYLQSAEKLWPQWTLTYVTEAQVLTQMEKYGDAANLYRQVLKNNPKHTVARIEMGILEYKYFSHYPQGEQYLNQALKSEDAPRPTLSRGYFGLAEIALKKVTNAMLSVLRKSRLH